MAKNLGLSQSTVSRIWRAFGPRPHRSETFQISKDPYFIEKVRDIVGLYMSPPVNALVLCVDEKSQIQALNRTQPILPMRPGQVERHTPEYQRNGTTSLFAALDVATGNVMGQCFRRQRQTKALPMDKMRRRNPQKLAALCQRNGRDLCKKSLTQETSAATEHQLKQLSQLRRVRLACQYVNHIALGPTCRRTREYLLE